MSIKKSQRKRLFLIDGYALLFRAHYAMIRNPLITTSGQHTSALFGFINMIFRLIRKENPDYIATAFDRKEKTLGMSDIRNTRPIEMKCLRNFKINLIIFGNFWMQ
jgi:hypothetical protein